MSLADLDTSMQDALRLDSTASGHWTDAIRPVFGRAAPARQNVMVVRSYSDLPVFIVGDGGVNAFAIVPSDTDGAIDPSNLNLSSYCGTNVATSKRCVPLTWDHVQNRPITNAGCTSTSCTLMQPGVEAVFIAARNIVVHGTVNTRGLSRIRPP